MSKLTILSTVLTLVLVADSFAADPQKNENTTAVNNVANDLNGNPVNAAPATNGVDYNQVRIDDLYSQGNTIELTPSESLAIEQYESWTKGGNGALKNSYLGSDGSTIFTFGSQLPSVVVGLMQLCDIELERGEVINSVNLGDVARWSVEPAISGSGTNQIQHVLVKALDINLSTNMLITTDRRSYMLNLKSHPTKNMSHIAFVYPQSALNKFKMLNAQAKAERQRQSVTNPTTGAKTYLGDLNFNYEIKGDVSWKPLRVFDDGLKTIIEMPKTIVARTAPSLVVLEKEGGLFSDEKTSIINYRLQGTRYIVDGLFEQAILTMDVGSSQQRVVIKRK